MSCVDKNYAERIQRAEILSACIKNNYDVSHLNVILNKSTEDVGIELLQNEVSQKVIDGIKVELAKLLDVEFDTKGTPILSGFSTNPINKIKAFYLFERV